jgi:hypothetical protein
LAVPGHEQFFAGACAGHEEQAPLAFQVLIVGLFVVFGGRDGIGCRHQFGADPGDAHAAKLQALHPVHGSYVDGIVVLGGLREVDGRDAFGFECGCDLRTEPLRPDRDPDLSRGDAVADPLLDRCRNELRFSIGLLEAS